MTRCGSDLCDNAGRHCERAGVRAGIFGIAERAWPIDVQPVRLEFSFGSIDQLWVDGKCPLTPSRDRKVKAKLCGKSDSNFPAVFEIGDLLCSERTSPLQ